MQVFHAILLEQILPNETIQVDSCLSQCIILVQSRFSLDCTEIASIIAHIQRLLLVSAEGITDCMRDNTSWVLCRVVISGGEPALEHVIGRVTLWWNLTVLYFDIIIGVRSDTFVMGSGLATDLWSISSLLIWFIINLALDRCAVACPAPLTWSSDVLLLLLLLLLMFHICNVWHILRNIRVHVDLLLVLSTSWK